MSHGHDPVVPQPFGLVAEFDSAEALLAAAEKTKEAGYRKTDAYSPFPIHGLSEAIGFHDVRLPWIIFMGGLIGCTFGYTLQWYTAVIDLPMNVGGKPLNSIPAFFPVTYESTILFSALTAVFAMMALNRLPKPYHSIFNTPGFERATQDRFFLAIESRDKQYDAEGTRQFLQGLNPLTLNEVME
ncbi:DUF3341 domain-containing protein [Fimbriimonas ginsengisoli]|uniref:ABC-type Fe3+ transport system protein n=1 Tax=Fimbriimonas ginsengisoli Gsoil 348 TaxID=661478 RepID=A0A068NQ89_FIMGI|nr:DUF3341 domain-containing protein [Fimbriimonas ginsengisoli]AIE85551.1 ABC-type Fe3+ transport system protein [Fimbriimonas ginsengisoli Gsoil 348]